MYLMVNKMLHFHIIDEVLKMDLPVEFHNDVFKSLQIIKCRRILSHLPISQACLSKMRKSISKPESTSSIISARVTYPPYSFLTLLPNSYGTYIHTCLMHVTKILNIYKI